MLVSDEPDQLGSQMAAAVRVLGLYHVAAEAGLTHQTLRKYLAGSSMRRDTITKLERWAAPLRGSIVTGLAYPKGATRLPAFSHGLDSLHGSGG
jgi:transcriptional regulator with XRE-family HTH domain